MTDYPYTYARVSAKRAKLLEKKDYKNLLKMEPDSISRNLEEGDYSKEINELGAKHGGVELVELALNKNLSRTLQDICGYAPEKLERVIKVYLRRYDIMSIKRLLRWQEGGEESHIEDLLVPMGSFTIEEMKELSEMDRHEILEEIDFPESDIDYQERIQGLETLPELERALDKAYYDELNLLKDEVKSMQFSKFIERELEYENLRTVLRLKKYGFAREEIESHLLSENGSKLIQAAINADSLEEAIELVKKEREITDVDGIEDLEHALEVYRLQKAVTMLHTEPLGVTSILGYIVAKIIEVKNLRMLIRAKETGIQNRETIRRNLVIA